MLEKNAQLRIELDSKLLTEWENDNTILNYKKTKKDIVQLSEIKELEDELNFLNTTNTTIESSINSNKLNFESNIIKEPAKFDTSEEDLLNIQKQKKLESSNYEKNRKISKSETYMGNNKITSKVVEKASEKKLVSTRKSFIK